MHLQNEFTLLIFIQLHGTCREKGGIGMRKNRIDTLSGDSKSSGWLVIGEEMAAEEVRDTAGGVFRMKTRQLSEIRDLCHKTITCYC